MIICEKKKCFILKFSLRIHTILYRGRDTLTLVKYLKYRKKIKGSILLIINIHITTS